MPVIIEEKPRSSTMHLAAWQVNKALNVLNRIGAYIARRDPVDYDFERPWARQPFDPPEAYRAFTDYLLGRRRLPTPEVLEWADRYAWAERAALYDRHIGDVRIAAVERLETTMAERHAALGRSVQRVGARELDKLAELASSQIGVMGERSTLAYLEAGIRIEREAAVPEQAKATMDLSRLSPSELRQWRELAMKAQAVG